MTTQPPPRAPQRRRRPSVAWFVVGGVLLVLAVAVFAVSLFLTLSPLADEDAVFTADGAPVALELPAGEERGVFVEDRSSRALNCQAVAGSGQEVELRSPGGEFTFNDWRAVHRFDTGDGRVTFTCTSAVPEDPDRVRIGALPSTARFVGGILIGILVPLALGGLGLAVIVVTAILFATGRPRSERT